MNFNIPKIEHILNNFDLNNPEDFQYSAICWDKWIDHFFTKDNKNKEIDRDLSFIERMNKLQRFQEETSASEDDFKRMYPDFKYDIYISPWDYDYKIVSEKKIQKMAFELQEHIPIEYNNLCQLLSEFLRKKNPGDCTFDGFLINLSSYDEDLSLKARIHIQVQKKLVA